MRDIHAHILPGIDDGAEDMYEALEMAQIAVDNGTQGIVCTPHCNIPGVFNNYYDEAYVALFRQMEEELKAENIPITLYAGMEVFVTERVPRLLAEGQLLTLNGSKNLLVEFSFDEDPDFANRMLQEIRGLGVRPVVAHPERYFFVQDDPQTVYDWSQKGYYVQVNKGSLLGRFGRKVERTAHALLKHNLVSAIASDTHSPYKRTPDMKMAYEELLSVYPEKYLNILFRENPARICNDEPIFRYKPKSFLEEEQD